LQVLDVEAAGSDESQAKILLRTAVLGNPDRANMAWAQLVNLCSRFAAEQSGANRLQLQQELLKVGIELNAPRSYQIDIERLREYSVTTLQALAYLSQIQVNSTSIKIHRPCTEALRQAAEGNSILVVGEPGAGKSGALHDFVEALKQEGRDCVFFAVDRLAARTHGELRIEIGLEHELIQVLDNWPGRETAFFVIDALDAARGDPAGYMIRDLIRMVVKKGNRWHVVASIRKFDLRYGVEIKELFAGNPPTRFRDAEFNYVQHLNVPVLSDEELGQIAPQSLKLQELVNAAPKELHDLLRVPFNLRLMAELLGIGVRHDELTPIRTQIELLDRYWSYRVIRSNGLGDAREAVLREACERMVETRTLRVDRREVAKPGSSADLDNLLSSQVLIEWQPSPNAPPERYILAFSHHVLFDYAVARLLLRGTTEALIRRLVNDPDLVLVVRPSLLFHFRHLWSGHEQFWALVFRVTQTDEIPDIGKLIGPAVSAELAKTLSDLEPLCVAFEDSRPDIQNAAAQVLRHLVGALLVRPPSEVQLLGLGAGPWCDLIERLSRNLRPPVAYAIRPLIVTLCEHPEAFTTDQRLAAGKAARRLLEFAWSHTSRDQYLVVHALQCVCRTYESDPEASAVLIKQSLDPLHLSQYGFEEMPWLAREVEYLIPHNAGLVEQIYSAAFSHSETSKDTTSMTQSRILPLTSNRQQDYEMAFYELAEAFPKFLKHSPQNATQALIAVIEAYVSQRHPIGPGESREDTFDFYGYQTYIRTDYSVIWDEGDTYRHDDPLKMLDAFQRYLEELAEQKEGLEILRPILHILFTKNKLAVLWRRLLQIGIKFQTTLSREILPFAWALPILTSYDTTVAVGDFIKAIFPTLDPNQRERIERAILTIPETAPSDRRQVGQHIRNRLLGCLEVGEVVTNEAKQLIEELRANNALPPNEPPVRFEGITSRPYGEEEYLKDHGVPIEAESNRKIRELERPIKEFADKHLNSTPDLKEVTTILPALQELHQALCNAKADGVHPIQQNYSWGYLTAACGRIARTDGLSCDETAGKFVKDVLLRMSHHPEPTPSPEYNAQFDEHPSWGSPAPRIEAAEGLIVLARQSTCAIANVCEAIERLSNDPVPAVRFQIASRLNSIYQTANDLMWRIIERMCKEEPSRGVLQGLLSGPLNRLAGAEPDRVAGLTKVVFERILEGPGARKVRDLCMGIFVGLYIWRNNPHCRDIVLNIVNHPGVNPDETNHLISHLREPLTHGPTDPPDPKQDAIRWRALELFKQILRSASNGLKQIEQCHSGVPFNKWPQEHQESAQTLARLIDHLAREIYFASGAYNSKKQTQADAPEKLKRLPVERFYKEAGPILDELADISFPSVAHHLLETLEAFIPLDPRGVFLRIGCVVSAGQKGGYQYESLAADLIVKLVERYIAEYRTLLRDDQECRKTLIKVLDIFVQAGWPSARRLTYRLEEIFR